LVGVLPARMDESCRPALTWRHSLVGGACGLWRHYNAGLRDLCIVVYSFYSFYTGSQPGSAYISRPITGRQN